jgi:hypothetical protein
VSRLAVAVLVVAVFTAALGTSTAAATPKRCGKFSRPGTVYRVIALRGVKCHRAREVAMQDSTGTAPAPWTCRVASDKQRYHGHKIGSTCGHGGHGKLRHRPHALLTVILGSVT